MDPNGEMFSKIEDIVANVLDMPEESREAYVRNKIVDNEELIDYVLNLVSKSHDASVFFQNVAASITATNKIERPRLSAGFELGNYQLVERLGRGGMGDVWLAQQTRPLKRKVALKLIRTGIINADTIIQFQAERQALAIMNHPYIANVYEADTFDDGRPYIAMEYIKGKPINKYCDDNRLSITERLKLFGRVCAGVTHLHQKSIVHRDIKPSNILVHTQDGGHVPKIIDLGVAETLPDSASQDTKNTRTMSLGGTPHYMSPEQQQLRVNDIDTRSDIFSLGVVLHVLLYGEIPSRRTHQNNLPSTAPSSQAVWSEQLCAFRNATKKQLVRKLQGDLDYILLKAQAYDIDDRYASVQALSADINRFLNNEMTEAAPKTVGLGIKKAYHRKKSLWNLGFAASCLLVGATFYYLSSVNAARDQAIASSERANATLDFLMNLFDSTNPDNGYGAAPTAIEMLKSGARRLDKDQSTNATVKVSILRAIGNSYQGLGQYEDARQMHLKELELLSSIGGDNNVEMIRTHQLLGTTYDDMGDHTAARMHLERAISIHRQHHIKPNTLYANVLTDYALVLTNLGEYEESLKLLKEARLILKKTEQNEILALNWLNTGEVYLMTEDDTKGEAAYRQAISITQANGQEKSPMLATAHHSLGILLYSKGDYDAAREEYESAVQLTVLWQGEDHPDLAATYGALGRLEQAADNYSMALQWDEKAYNLMLKTLGPDNPEPWFHLSNIANSRFSLGEMNEAESRYKEVLSNYQRVLDSGHWYEAKTRMSYAKLLLAQDRFTEAEFQSKLAITISKDRFPEGHWYISQAHCYLGEALLGQSQYQEASTIIQEHAKILIERKQADSVQGRYATQLLERIKSN